MFCEKHKVKMHEVCGEMMCGMCFADLMEVENLVAPKRPKVEVVMIHKRASRVKARL